MIFFANIEFVSSQNNESNSLKGWVINPGQNKALVYYGGNAENVEMQIPVMAQPLTEDSSTNRLLSQVMI